MENVTGLTIPKEGTVKLWQSVRKKGGHWPRLKMMPKLNMQQVHCKSLRSEVVP